MICHYPAKCGGGRHCGSGCIIVLLFPLILLEYISKGSSNYVLEPLKLGHLAAKLIDHRHPGS